ncbi:hypothetical protein [Pseudoalteromonas sp. KAN5]|uniref:hypothetical protein n=1 Tax=Pseudoalteromonas sp. KAN5 TaxID=2916633 RepID=UPI001FCB4C7B|nr:hypothetical protein [Pseudoalteromonas sp. KAN5]BDF94240.1 hypothetical protein KAN5_10780 [Pseudoalteromonas sp. KAN5]
MRNFGIYVIVLLLPCLAHGDDGYEVIFSYIVSETSCSNVAKFQGLFELSISREYSGVAQQQYLAEVNEKSLINCPKEFVVALMDLNVVDKEAVLDHLGIVHPPWEIAQALKPLLEDEEVSGYIENELSGFFKIPAP